MRVLISGASGLVGTELARQLREDGHEAIRLVRRAARAADEISWNPSKGQIDPEIMESVDAVVNLAGAIAIALAIAIAVAIAVAVQKRNSLLKN